MAQPIELVEPRILKGFRDVMPSDVSARQRMIDKIRAVYESYGFLPLETPALEYVDVLGKYLPESDSPEGGIFAFRDDSEWISLRYDLTAPLSRFVAQYRELPMPFRRYQVGPVWRREKVGPGRYREFYQMDFDSVGVPGVIADSEACCIISDTLETLGISKGDYIVRVNNRKILSGILESSRIEQHTSVEEASPIALNVLRTIDKLDRIGIDGVTEILEKGRIDDSGDFIPGLGLNQNQITVIKNYLSVSKDSRLRFCEELRELLDTSEIGREGIHEMLEMNRFLSDSGYDESKVVFDPTVVRGLAYYTGPVFEAVLTFPITDEFGETRQFGSVFGGGRYDDLVKRFTGERVPATGASIGVDRLLSALKINKKIQFQQATARVLVVVFNRDSLAEYHRLANELRKAGINAELYIGRGSVKDQLEYADATGKEVVVLFGNKERSENTVSLKDLKLGRELAEKFSDRDSWIEERPAQKTVPRTNLIMEVKKILSKWNEEEVNLER